MRVTLLIFTEKHKNSPNIKNHDFYLSLYLIYKYRGNLQTFPRLNLRRTRIIPSNGTSNELFYKSFGYWKKCLNPIRTGGPLGTYTLHFSKLQKIEYGDPI